MSSATSSCFLAEEFHKPPERTPEQLMQAVMQLVNHATGGMPGDIGFFLTWK
jgi:hypothetical protein